MLPGGEQDRAAVRTFRAEPNIGRRPGKTTLSTLPPGPPTLAGCSSSSGDTIPRIAGPGAKDAGAKRYGPTAGWAPRCVVVPPQPGTDPGDAWRGARRPGHEGVVCVGDHYQTWGGLLTCVAPSLGDLAHLVVAVQLVAAQVEQYEQLWPSLGTYSGQPRFVDLEYRRSTRRAGGQCRSQARWQVGSQQVRHYVDFPAFLPFLVFAAFVTGVECA